MNNPPVNQTGRTSSLSDSLGGETPEIREYPLFRRGKVRDVYDLGDKLLIVASDRISAFDVVLPTPIPDKGAILTQLSLFWFELLGFPNHLLAFNIKDYPSELRHYGEALARRSMLVQKAERFDVECVVRGYLSGSGWKDYQRDGAICGISLPKGLKPSDKLPEPIFTPAAKNDTGHDENIDFATMEKMIGASAAAELKKFSLNIYRRASEYAAERGIILADTKFEFGKFQDHILLIDEVLTPDSSRFWPADAYQPGQDQPSFDKQFVRDYLAGLDWNKTAPGPELPAQVVAGTREKYLEAYRKLTGRVFSG